MIDLQSLDPTQLHALAAATQSELDRRAPKARRARAEGTKARDRRAAYVSLPKPAAEVLDVLVTAEDWQPVQRAIANFYVTPRRTRS